MELTDGQVLQVWFHSTHIYKYCTMNLKAFWSNILSAGSKKVPSCHLGQEDFPVSQVIFHSHLPEGKEPGQVFCQLKLMSKKPSKLRLAQGMQNLRAACPISKLEFKLFLSRASALDYKVFKHDRIYTCYIK